MNVKILACTAIATSLLFTACVKKEEPKETEKQQTPKSSVVNQIPKDQQVKLPTDNNANGIDNTDPANATDNNANNNAVDLQASPGPSDTPVAPVRSVEKPRPVAPAEPRKPVQTTQVEKKPTPEANKTTDIQDDTVVGKTERVKAPAQSETPRATPAPITEKADQAQSIDDAIKQAIDAATPAK
ncbi:hypothetical protein [Moraxella sp. ZY210820]|uniref:hypothetical protein n=1 Tax=unclassified Moraxella TaxID=2685852 RepID=UPI0027301837|nr:hypothetical protein [Moraxella sp. ZY210820]WLF84751.1 hypothetical protein LU301_04595 [Moraxella sp. ZY210820]